MVTVHQKAKEKFLTEEVGVAVEVWYADSTSTFQKTCFLKITVARYSTVKNYRFY